MAKPSRRRGVIEHLALFDGRPFRVLAVLDVHTREALAIVLRTSFRAFQVTEVLDRLAAGRGRPRVIKVDNGPEFAGKMLDRWAYLNGVGLDFSRPGKPVDNADIEAFNARLRQDRERRSRSERVLVPVFGQARDRVEEWRTSYNEERPHTALGNLTPSAFASQAHQARRVA